METLTVDLDIEGMTCASCVARVEKRLTRIEGVDARVNLATERARVRFPAEVAVGTLLEAVDAAGYRATLVEPASRPREGLDALAGARSSTTADRAATEEGVETPKAGAEASARRDPLTRRLIVSAALAIPVVVVAMIPALQFPGWQWVSLVLATPVVLWGGWPFHRAAAVNLRHGSLTMDTLVSLGTLTAYLWSVWALVFGHAGEIGMRHEWVWGVRGMPGGDVYFEVAAGVVAVILAGRVLEARSKRRAGRALRALAELAPSEATLVETDASGRASERRIPLAELRAGDRFAVRPGERVAADGVVVEGEAAVDERMLTGEPAPVDVEPGSRVTGATIVADGRLVVEATRVGADARLAQIARLVEDAQVGSSRAQRLADRISAVFVPVVIALAIGTAIVWTLAGSPVEQALTAAVAVLVIACPCALGLATPMAILVGTGRGAARGILITGPEALDRTGRADTIVLDKTGTLTTGRMRLAGVVTDGETDASRALAVAAALEHGSEHPIARAVVDAAERDGLRLPAVARFRAHRGLGVTAEVEGAGLDRVEAACGRLAFLDSLGYGAGEALRARAEASDATAVGVAWGGRVRAVLEIDDTVRETARGAIEELKALGLAPVLATGDAARPAARVAAALGIDEVHAALSPEGKLALVRDLQAAGRTVAMAGDGVNDAPALAGADLGIAMGGGADAAAAASDLALLRDDPAVIPEAVRLSRATLGTIRGNLFWAFAYNVAAIPLAAAGLLNPMIAGAAMAGSSVFVVLNSLRLRRS